MPDFGEDLAGVDDIDFALSTVTGMKAVGQAVARRLITPAGALFYDPDYGYDLRQFMNAAFIAQPSDLSARVEEEALKDERVLAARARVSFINGALTVRLVLETAFGVFPLTLTVDALSVQVLTPSLA